MAGARRRRPVLPAGLVLSVVALGRVRRDGTRGRGLAVSGIVASTVFAAISVAFFVSIALAINDKVRTVFEIGPRYDKARAVAETKSDLESVAASIRVYGEAHGGAVPEQVYASDASFSPPGTASFWPTTASEPGVVARGTVRSVAVRKAVGGGDGFCIQLYTIRRYGSAVFSYASVAAEVSPSECWPGFAPAG